MIREFYQTLAPDLAGETPIPVSGDLISDFESISTEGDFIVFCDKYRLFDPPGLGTVESFPTIDDYYGVNHVLLLAIRLREIATSETATLDELLECGVSEEIFAYPFGDSRWFSFSFVAHGLNYHAFLYHALGERGVHYLSYDWADATAKFLNADDLEIEAVADGGVRYRWKAIAVCGIGDDVPVACIAQKALDTLFSLHLSDVDTVTRCGVPYQRAATGLSALWLAYGNSFARYRVLSCKACRKPFVVMHENGREREYCSDACRRWSNRHKGEVRSAMRLKVKPPSR